MKVPKEPNLIELPSLAAGTAVGYSTARLVAVDSTEFTVLVVHLWVKNFVLISTSVMYSSHMVSSAMVVRIISNALTLTTLQLVRLSQSKG